MTRRKLIGAAVAGSVHQLSVAQSIGTAAAQPPPAPAPFRVEPCEWEEATITDLGAAMNSGKASAESLTKGYLERIEALDRQGPSLRAVIELNPEARDIARSLDEERRTKGPRGPLHGVPVLLKDNIDTHDKMTTTAGSLALEGSRPLRDSFVTQKLREAGAVILGKTNLSEWANFRGHRSSSGWSARGGQTQNPYVLDRNPSGSSSGSAVAVAANLCAAAIGTETDGSIVSPASLCGIVGLKPTVGLISRFGIIPISQSQDTAGPMTRTVRDAAILLAALTGVDSRDPSTEQSSGKTHVDYTKFLDADTLRGARLGVARRFFRPGRAGNDVVEAAVQHLKERGAEIIELTDQGLWSNFGDAEHTLMLYEFKAGLNAYFALLGPESPVRTVDDVIAFNIRQHEKELRFFGQETLLKAREMGPLTDSAYLEAVEKARRLSRVEGIDAIIAEHKLDAIVAPSGGPAGTRDPLYGDRDSGGSSSPAAVAGYPNITVPAGFTAGLPVGISFFGPAFSEPKLLALAFAFEQSNRARKPPRFLPAVG